jgi:hypothetical protein
MAPIALIGNSRATVKALIVANDISGAHIERYRPIFRRYARLQQEKLKDSYGVGVTAEITYFGAPLFIAADDGIASEPKECCNPIAVVMRARALSRNEDPRRSSRSAARVARPSAISAMPR